MKRISAFSSDEIIEYNLRDGGTAVSIFADTQTHRVTRARAFLGEILTYLGRPASIVELGCSAGDISGWFSSGHEVTGVDIVPAAVSLARQRYPNMTVLQGTAEEMAPQPCDVIVLCEFLEHVANPTQIVKEWLPLAEFAIIGHPLHDPGGLEPGHIWSYDLDDYFDWLGLGQHTALETHLFQGPFPEMVMGSSRRIS